MQAQLIQNHPEGVIEAKQTQVLTGNQGQFINQGLIDGQITKISANEISNLEGGKLYGDQLLLATETLVNHPKESNSKPIIAARKKLTIGAQKIVNQAGSLIMSGGSMTVGGQLDEQQQLQGSNALLDNLSATIDVQGEARFTVATFNNRDIFFSSQPVEVSATRYRKMQRDGDTVRVPINAETLRNFTDTSYTVYDYHRTVSETAIRQQSPAQLLVGQNLTLTGSLNNDKSQVIIGGKLTGSMKSINHIDAFGNRVIKEQGTTQFTYTDWVRDTDFFRGTQFKRIWQPPVSYQVEVENSRYPLKLTVEQPSKGSISSSHLIAQRTQTAISPSEEPVALTLSLAPLFRINHDNPHQPLVSSDPRLFNYQGALGLSGLVDPFSREPLPRLCGDVGYEQQLIREQLMALTGHRFLPGYQNDAEQHLALLNQGAKAAETLRLIPGNALTAEQQQRLTADMVWPVKQPIVLETGETAEVLIPKLYVRHSFPKPPGTALITAHDIELLLSEELNSRGTLLAQNHCQISAKSVDNQGMMAAAVTQLTAQRSIVQRGLVVGEQALRLQAGRDIHLPSTLNTSKTHHDSGNHCLHTTLGERARLLVTRPEGVLSLQAERDIDLTAAQVLHTGWQGHTLFSADRNLTVGAATVGYRQRIQQQPDDHLTHSRYREIGSQIKVAGSIHCQAKNDFQAIASEISSGIPINQNAIGNPPTALENSQETDVTLATREQKVPTFTIQAGHHLTTRGGETVAYSIRKGHFAASLHEQKVETPCQLTSHQPQGHLQLAAKKKMDLKATQLQQCGQGGDITVIAGDDLNLGTQANHQRQYIEYAQGYISRGSEEVAGNHIQSTGTAKILAGHNLTATAAQISSGQADNQTETSSTVLSTGNEQQGANHGDLHLLAGNQLTVASAPTHHYFYQRDYHQRQQSLAAASLTNQAPQATLAVQAGQEATLTAVNIDHQGRHGRTQITAGCHLTLDTLKTSQQQEHNWDADNFLRRGCTAEVGNQINSVGAIELKAGDTLQTTAVQVSSQAGHILAAAGKLLAIQSGQTTEDYDHATKAVKKGFFSDKTVSSRDTRHQTRVVGSQLSGEQVTLVAGNSDSTTDDGDLFIQGSQVVGEQKTNLVAHNRLSITGSEAYQQKAYARQEEKSGLFFTGGSLCLGEQQWCRAQRQTARRYCGSTIGSLSGEVALVAQQHYMQQGSQVVAPQGDITIAAGSLEILDALEQQQLEQESHRQTSGLTIGMTNPALSAWQTANQLGSAASQTSDPRMQALAAVTGGLAAKNLSDAIKTNPSELGGVNFSMTVGDSESHSNSREQHTQAQRSQIIGRNITAQAREGNATLQGDFQATEQLQLTAAQTLKILASQSQSHQQSSQSSSSQAFGVGFGSSGNGITTSLSVGNGDSQGHSTRYQLAQVSGGQKVILQSGGDTLIQGVVKGNQLQGQIGGNLTVESLQDTDYQQGQQQQLGVNLTVGPNRVSGSINVNKNQYRSDYASVQQQAGLKAGDGGLQCWVKENFHLGGAVMTGSDEAVKNNRIQIVAGTLTQKAIENRADYDASSVGLGLGFSRSLKQLAAQNGVGKNQLGQATAGALQVPGSQLPSQKGFSAPIPIVMHASDSVSSSTLSGISNAAQAVTLTNPAAQQALTGQTPEQAIASLNSNVISGQDGGHALKSIFNQQEIEAGFQIVGALTREVGTFLENRTRTATQAQQALETEQAKPLSQQDPQCIQQLQQTLHDHRHWEMGGNGRLLMTAFTLAAGGNVTGSAGQLLQSTVVNTLQGLGAQQIKLLADSLNSETARTALQGLLAGAGAAAQGQNAIPAALGASGSVVLNNLFDAAYGERSQALTLDERQARRNLVTSIISGTTQALGGDAALANTAAAIETENNSAAITLGAGMALAGESLITGAALVGGGAVAATVGMVSGSAYLLKEDAQNQADAQAVLTGDKTLAQVITERGSRCCQEVELKVMLTQLQQHLTVEEKLYLHESLSLHNYEISKRDLAAMGKKYLPQGFQVLDPKTLPTHTGGNQGTDLPQPGKYIFPTADPQPIILPGAPIQPAGPTTYVTPAAEPLPTHTRGTPLDRPEPITVMIKDGIDNRLPIPKATMASNGLRLESNSKHTPGCQGFGPLAGVEPKNSQALFGDSVALPGNSSKRYAKDRDGHIHQFSESQEGLYHWSGSTADERNPLDLKNPIKAQLRKEFGWKIK